MSPVYSKYFINARESITKFSKEDLLILNFIYKHIKLKSNVFEVACGEGSFLSILDDFGYNCNGIDIAELLIKKCKENYPRLNCSVGDAEDIKKGDNLFDFSFCFHPTHYFFDIKRFIREIIRVTKNKGHIFFDINNADNKDIHEFYNKRISESKGLGKIKLFLKNILKLIFRKGEFNRLNWSGVIYETPTSPNSIINYLEEINVKGYKIMIIKNNKLNIVKKSEDLSEYRSIYFYFKKN